MYKVHVKSMVAAILCLMVVGGCSGDDDASDRGRNLICEPGARRVCPCPSVEAEGYQRCNEEGMEWRECQCPEPDTGDGDDSRDTGVADAGTDAGEDDGCAGGECRHRVFVTSNEFDGNRGGVEGADELCNNIAEEANLQGNWKAIMSELDSIAVGRLTIEGPVYNFNSEVVADDKSDMWDGSLDAPIKYDENRNDVGDADVWTGADQQGGKAQLEEACDGWRASDNTGIGTYGIADRTDASWVNHDTDHCDREARIYCIDGQ